MSTIETTVPAKRTADELAPPLTLRQMTWRRFRRHKMAMVGLVMLVLLVLYCLVGALFVSEAYANYNDLTIALQPPSAAHPFGTDTIGRDILARTIYGGQISLLIGVTAVIVEVSIGVVLGALAGYFGGRVDSIIMRFTEVVLIIPSIFLLIAMAKFFGNKVPDMTILGRQFSGSVVVIVLILGLTSWPYLARIVRSQFLSFKENEFILAARATGSSTRSIIFGTFCPTAWRPSSLRQLWAWRLPLPRKRISVFWVWGCSRPPRPGATCWKAHTTTLTRRPGCGFFRGCLFCSRS